MKLTPEQLEAGTPSIAAGHPGPLGRRPPRQLGGIACGEVRSSKRVSQGPYDARVVRGNSDDSDGGLAASCGS